MNWALINLLSFGEEEDSSLDELSNVSKAHSRVYRADKGIYIEDLNSLNGTFLNGAAVNKGMILSNDDIIDIGQVKMRITLEI